MPPPTSSSSTTSGGLTSSGAVAGLTHARPRPPRRREDLPRRAPAGETGVTQRVAHRRRPDMINFTSMTLQQPIRRSRDRRRFDRGSGRLLFPLSDTLRAVQAAGDRNPGVVPFRCPVLSAASVAPEQRLRLAVLVDAF